MERAATVTVTASPGLEGMAALAAGGLRLDVGGRADDRSGGDPATRSLTLHLGEDGWSLRDGDLSVRADFVEGRMAARIRDARRGEARLATALGLKRDPHPLVLDATAGLGRDSVLAAALGCDVIACERSPIVALLLRDALVRADGGRMRELASRIDVREEDARDVLPTLDDPPDVILVDPMFPERDRSSKAQKEMQLLQHLLGPDEDGTDALALLDSALAYARERVVVKRPPHAPPVGDRRPSFTVEGKAVRFDVYVVRRDDREDAPDAALREGREGRSDGRLAG